MTVVILPRDAFENLADEMRGMPGKFLKAFYGGGRKFRRGVEPRVSQTPGPVVYPIQWTTARQRAAFFATDGFGAGIPYSRSGSVSSAWDYQEGVVRPLFRFYNTNETATFVIGDDQQQFHKNTGWQYVPDILHRESEKVVNDIVVNFYRSL